MRRTLLIVCLLGFAPFSAADVGTTILTRLGLAPYLQDPQPSLRRRLCEAYLVHVEKLLAGVPARDRDFVGRKLASVVVVDDSEWESENVLGLTLHGIVHRPRRHAGLASSLFNQVHEDFHVVYYWAGPSFFRSPFRNEFRASRGEFLFRAPFLVTEADFDRYLVLMFEEYEVDPSARAEYRDAILSARASVSLFSLPSFQFPLAEKHREAFGRFYRRSPLTLLLLQRKFSGWRYALHESVVSCAARLAAGAR